MFSYWALLLRDSICNLILEINKNYKKKLAGGKPVGFLQAWQRI